jgi:hypothetical protein
MAAQASELIKIEQRSLGSYMHKRMKELGDAINETLANSDLIADVIARIKAEGYDVFLVLEATVGFNKKEEDDSPDSADEADEATAPPEFKITAQDLRFLKSLRIAVDDKKAA